FGGAFAALYLIYTLQRFEANALAYGLLVACGGVGALVGSFCASWCARRFGLRRTLIGSALLHGLLSFCTPLAAGPMFVVFALMALSQLFGDIGFAIYSINEISLRQQLVPDHLLGRINACMQMLSNGIMPLGALLAGLLSEIIGIRLTLLIGCVGIVLAPAWLFFSPLRRSL
ncbi:MAG TPA: MFS transporter, partial [Ktedonobacteraceae bacterium]